MNDSLNPDDSGKNNQSKKDATLKPAKDALWTSEMQLQTLFDQVPIGIYLVDADFRIRAVNRAALPVFGRVADLIGRDFDEVIHILWSKEYADEIVRLFRHTLRTGEPYYTPERIEERRDRSATEYYEWQINRIRLPDDSYGVVCYFRDIAERVLTKENLRESEEKYRALFNSIDEGFCIIEVLFDGEKAIDYRFLEVSPSWEKQTGLLGAVGKTMRELVPQMEEYWFEIYGEIIRTNEPVRFENRAAAMNRWYDVYAFRCGAPEKNQIAILFNDITTRKQAETSLRQSEERLQLSIEGANIFTWEVNPQTGETKYSSNFNDVVGFKISTDAKENFLNIPEEERERVAAAVDRAIRGESPLDAEHRVVNPETGEIIWVRAQGQLASVHTENAPAVFLGITQNITERKLAEEALRESEERLRTLVENLPGGAVFVVDKNLRYLVAQGEALTAAGFAPEDLIGRTINETMPPELVAEYEALYRQTLAGESFSHEHSAHNRSFISRGVPLRAATGEIYAVIAVSYDITERKRAEELLRESEERLRLLVESASDYAIFTLTLDGRINSWNAGAEKVFGWTESEILGESTAIVFTPEDRAAGEPEKEIETALRTGRALDERFHLRKDGSRFYVSGVITLLKNARGDLQGFAKIARDMTERIEAERVVRDKETLQKIIGAQEDERRRIARDLHDHLGQQMTALRLKLEILKQACDGDEKMHRQVDVAQAIAGQIDSDIDFISWEMRPSALDDIGLLPALERYVREWSRQFGIAADFRAGKFGKNRLAADAETHLYRIAQECLNNVAKHARAGNVDVSLERRHDFAVLIIEDDGIGFSPNEIAANTAKHIGLVGMRERAALIQGTMEIESAPGTGTTVFVRVPVSNFKSPAKRKKKKDE